jgi:inorganic triphosphatase YgiF
VLTTAQVGVEAPISARPSAFGRGSREASAEATALRADDPLPEAGRAIMAFHFARLQKLEKAAAAADEEAIHDMRVATRRIRAAFRIAGPYYKPKAVKFHRAELRRLAQELGAARDLDVIIGHAQAFAGRRPPDAPPLQAWLDHLQSRRAEAQQNLLDPGRQAAREIRVVPRHSSADGAVRAAIIRPARRACAMIPAAIWAVQHRAYEAIAEPPLETRMRCASTSSDCVTCWSSFRAPWGRARRNSSS